MAIPTRTDSISTVADLQKSWDQLKDVDRAAAVYKFHKAGTSYRALGKALGRSQSLLRSLNLAAQASHLDRILARKGEISTRELVRRATGAKALQAGNASQALERERKKASERVCEAICEFLDREQWGPQYGEILVDEARAYLASVEAALLVPPTPFPPLCLPLVDALERLWPPSTGDAAEDTDLYAESLVNFVIAALPDSMSRHRALGLALDVQISKPSSPTQLQMIRRN